MTRARKRRYAIILGAIAAVVIAACTLTLSLGDGDRRIVTGDLVTTVIVPTYDDVAVRADALKAAAHAFGDAATLTTLGALRDAWRAAREPWKETDAFRFGPMALQSLGVAMDQVVDTAKIDLELAGTDTIDAAYFATLGANKKGFHAIEYLVFDSAGLGDTAVLARLTDPRRAAFVVGAAEDIAVNAHALRDGWANQGASLADPGSDNADYPTIKDSIDALVNESTFQAEVIADARLGHPFGTKTGGVPHPEFEESGPSDTSIDDMAGALRGIRNIYLGSRDGSEGSGIDSLVVASNPSVDRDVRAALTAAATAIAAIPTPYRQALLDQDPRILAAYTAMQELQQVYATEVIASLGATLKFNDNDGD